MSTVPASPRAVPAPATATSPVRWAAAGLVAGLVLALAGAHQLAREIPRQLVLAPLASPGGWQRAMVAKGVRTVAGQAEQAALRIDDPAALRDGAAVLGSLATATGDPDAVHDLQRRALALARRSLDMSPGSAQAHLLSGAALLDVGNDPERGAWHLARAAARPAAPAEGRARRDPRRRSRPARGRH